MADDEKNTTGEIDPSKWDEAVAVTGRPNDEPAPNSTFGDRAEVAKSAPVDEPDVQTEKKPAKTASRKRKA